LQSLLEFQSQGEFQSQVEFRSQTEFPAQKEQYLEKSNAENAECESERTLNKGRELPEKPQDFPEAKSSASEELETGATFGPSPEACPSAHIRTTGSSNPA